MKQSSRIYFFTMTTVSTLLLVLPFALFFSLPATAAEEPWRLGQSLGLGPQFQLSGSQRLRFESISDKVRPGSSINDELLTSRTILDGQYQQGGFRAQLEVMDARQKLGDRDSSFGTDAVNTLDVLQATVGYQFQAASNNTSEIKLGRFTSNWGSRRQLARNRYRNTINAFDGIDATSRWSSGNQFRVMAAQPVRRLPGDRASLLDNERESDDSSDAVRLFGVQAILPNLFNNATTELYYLNLREKDTADVQTRNRRLHSLGFRVTKASSPGQYDFDIESIFQTGKSRSSSATSNLDSLDHQAFFQFASIGYTFDYRARPNVRLELAYGSGDDNPLDGDNERFDPLFGVSTFEFGPVGLYGEFNHSNIITPGIKVDVSPREDLNVMLYYRHFWLASDKDSWGRTGLRDSSGNTDSYLGQHTELRLRWEIIPGNLRIEARAVLLNAKNLSNNNSIFTALATIFTF